jgi:hypothetical protein
MLHRRRWQGLGSAAGLRGSAGTVCPLVPDRTAAGLRRRAGARSINRAAAKVISAGAGSRHVMEPPVAAIATDRIPGRLAQRLPSVRMAIPGVHLGKEAVKGIYGLGQAGRCTSEAYQRLSVTFSYP